MVGAQSGALELRYLRETSKIIILGRYIESLPLRHAVLRYRFSSGKRPRNGAVLRLSMPRPGVGERADLALPGHNPSQFSSDRNGPVRKCKTRRHRIADSSPSALKASSRSRRSAWSQLGPFAVDVRNMLVAPRRRIGGLPRLSVAYAANIIENSSVARQTESRSISLSTSLARIRQD